MDALHVLPSSRDLDAGLSAAVLGLTSAQRQIGLKATLLAADSVPFTCRHRALLAAAREHQPRVLHSHGLWLSPSHASRCWRRRGQPTVVTPHGMLDPWTWSRRRHLKRLRWRLGEAETVTRASCLQALCTAEAQVMRELGLSNPIAIIPNGVAAPERPMPLPLPPWHGQVPDGERVLLFLGRFHAKKGIQPLLKAWSHLQQQHSAGIGGGNPWWLVFVGFDDGGELARQLKQQPIPRCLVAGPAFGPAKDSAYAHASGFVLPSFSEGLPLAALEAMSWGLPCLLSEACNLPEAFETGAAGRAEPEDSLKLEEQLLAFGRLSDDQHVAMAQAGQALVAQRFSWSGVADQCRILYDWISGTGEKPDFLYPCR